MKTSKSVRRAFIVSTLAIFTATFPGQGGPAAPLAKAPLVRAEINPRDTAGATSQYPDDSGLAPTVVLEPTNVTVAVESTAVFTVVAAGTPPLSYFWSRNGTLITNATAATYSLPAVQLSDSGSWFACLVTNAYGTATSSNAYLKVFDTVANGACDGAVVITTASSTNSQSTLKADSPGNPVPDCVEGFGHGVWYQLYSPVAGELEVDTFGSDFDTGLGLYTGTCDALTELACNDDAAGGQTSQIMVPTTADTTYFILAGGYASDAGNLVLHVNYLTPPVFDVEPTNLLVIVSSNAVFSPLVSGAAPISFQWYFDNAPLTDGGRVSGSASASLTIAGVTTNDAGNYQLVASNSLGVATSSVAVLTPVILPPSFLQPPADLAVGEGSNAVFTAVAGGTPPFNYQWYFHGTPLADDGVRVVGSLTSSLTLSNVTTANGGSYSLTVTNVSGATSAAATLNVLTPPVATSDLGRSVPPGLPTTFRGSVSGAPAPTCQWQLNGRSLPGATNLTYTVAAVGSNELGWYTLVASNLMGVTVGAPAELTFGPVAAWGNNTYNACLPPPGLSNVVSVAGDDNDSFAVLLDGSIAAWGGGPGTNSLRGATNVVALAAGEEGDVYALRSDGTLAGWNGAVTPAVSNLVAVSAGNEFGVGLRAEGSLVTWGSVAANWLPGGLSHITAVAINYAQGLALRDDGTVVAWGAGPGTNVPPGLGTVTAVAVGFEHSLALISDGTVVAWGSGPGTNVPAGLTNVVAIYASGYSSSATIQNQSLSLALRADGTVVAWGDDYFGETNVPAALGKLNTVAGAAAPYRSLALVNDGHPQILRPPVGLTTYAGRSLTLPALAAGATPLSYQWSLNGTNLAGATNASLFIPAVELSQAGNYQLLVSNSLGTALTLPAPVAVLSGSAPIFLSRVSASAARVYQGEQLKIYSGAVLGNGPLTYQWYFAPSNSVGQEVFYPPSSYHAISGATNDTLTFDPALAIHTGNYYVAVSNHYGGVISQPIGLQVFFEKAWGYGAVDAPFVLTNAIAVALGNFGETAITADYLALSSAGKVVSWTSGFSQYGETNFARLSNSIVTAIAAGDEDTLMLKSDGTVVALGGSYQLTSAYSLTNVPAGANGITAIACGDYHDLALRYDGTVVGWGQNLNGQTASAAATNVVAIAAGGQDSIALRADGTVTTWGMYGANHEYAVPVQATNIVAVAAGEEHFLALGRNGTVIGWGVNSAGQISIPTNWTNIVAIAAGGTHSTALRGDGSVMVVGGTAYGSFSNYVPANLSNLVAIAANGDRDLGLFGTRAPAFTVQPWDRTIANTATSVWFAAKCAGAQPIHYQWMFNGASLPGATNETLIVNATVTNQFQRKTPQPLASGVYQLVASNAYGVLASHYAQLAVVIPLGVALNATNLNWTTTGDGKWFGETNVTHDGVAAAQSGDIGPFQDTILQTTLVTNAPGNCTFWWKVSSEPDLDVLEFRLNGIVQADISGNVDWQQVNLPVAAGTNVLMWHYYKNSIYSSGLDAGWVDQFAFALSPEILRQPASSTNYAGTSANFGVEAESKSPEQLSLGYQWQKNGVNLTNIVGHVNGANAATLFLYNVQDADAATYTVVVTNSAGGAVTSQPATLTVLDSPPTITRQPVGGTNNAGATVGLFASVVGAVPMHYEWYQNGADLGMGGTGSGEAILVLTNLQDANAGLYTVVITNVDGSATSAPALLTVWDGSPAIVTQPASATVLRGRSATLAVTATGTSPVSYQWQHGGTNLIGATNAWLTLAQVGFGDAGAYAVVVTNRYGSILSSAATLNVVHSLVVAWGEDGEGQTDVPLSLTNVVAIAAGAAHSLALQGDGTVVAWGGGDGLVSNVPPTLSRVVKIAAGAGYSLALTEDGSVAAWGYSYDGETNVPAGLSETVAMAAGEYHNLALADDGTVTAWGYDNNGETNVPPGLTNVVAISAGGGHSAVLEANGQVLVWGDDYFGETNVPAGLSSVTAIASGAENLVALQADGTVVAWGDDYVGEIDVPAGLTNVVAIAAGYYHTLALQADGSVTAWGEDYYGQTDLPPGLSNVVAIAGGQFHSLAVVGDGSPFIARQPTSQWAPTNATVQFTAAVRGIPPFAYQWQKNGVNLADGGKVAGSTAATLTLTNVQTADVASYTVVVSNSIDRVVSLPAALIVAGPPGILAQPASQTVDYGATVQLGVFAVGNPPPVYTWWWNGTNQVGGNAATLTLTGVTRAQDGVYSVLVTNIAGGVLSSNVLLQVLVPQVISTPTLLPNGSLVLTSGDVGGGTLPPTVLTNFEVLVSSNLVDWASLPGVLSITNGQLQVEDQSWTNFPSRFYRIIEH